MTFVIEVFTWYQVHVCEREKQCCYQNLVSHRVQEATHFGCLALKITGNPPVHLAAIQEQFISS